MITVDWTLGLQFANFVVLLVILNFILYRPLRKMLNERRETIDGSYAKAKDLEAQVNEKMALYQDQLQAAKIKGNAEREQVRKAASAEEAEILGQAQSKAAGQLREIKAGVAEEAQRAGKALKADADDLAAQIATKVLGRKLK